MTDGKEIDDVTGVETTGHEWDGIKELNKPLPRWWLWTFYACIVWSVGYWILYPTWPTLTGYTKGVLGYSQRATVARELADAKAAQGTFRKSIADASLQQIATKQQLLEFARSGGAAAFGDNCAPCHGRGAQGAVGYPNLNDDVWIWGGTLADITQTIRFGVRSGHKKARFNEMPRFGLDDVLKPEQISDVADYVLSLSGRSKDTAAIARGKPIFATQCVACHGKDAKGKQDLGAPNLTDAIWLFGGSKAQVVKTIETGRSGVMPHWEERLDSVTIKMLAVYVHSLGGGK